MSQGVQTEVSRLGIQRRANLLVHQRDDLSGQSANQLDKKDATMPEMRGLQVCSILRRAAKETELISPLPSPISGMRGLSNIRLIQTLYIRKSSVDIKLT